MISLDLKFGVHRASVQSTLKKMHSLLLLEHSMVIFLNEVYSEEVSQLCKIVLKSIRFSLFFKSVLRLIHL